MNRVTARIGCLIVAVLVWIQVASDSSQESTLMLPLELVNVPEGCIVSGASERLVRVRMRGSRLKYMTNRILGRPAGRVMIDLVGESEGPPIQREVTINDVRSDMTVLEVTPPVRLRLRIDLLETRSLPVEVVTAGSLPDEYVLLAAPVSDPDSVVVSGPRRLFETDVHVRTEELEMGDVRGESVRELGLVSSQPGLTVETEEVSVTVLSARLESRLFPNVPVTLLQDAGQPSVRAEPPVADVLVSGPVDSLRVLAPARLAVTLALTGLAEGQHEITGEAILPLGFGLVSLEPSVFIVTIGEGDSHAD